MKPGRGRRAVSACIGVFDGVHRGHQKIIRTTVALAKRSGLASVGLTFEPHPARILRPASAPPRLQALAQRVWHMKRLGLEQCAVIRFTKAFSRMSAESFVQNFLCGFLRVRILCVGKDFRFGRGGAGNAELLGEWADRYGYRLRVIPPVRAGGAAISSTRIRRLLAKGRLREARRLIGRPASLYGRVVHGRGRGRNLGFPTVNLRLLQDMLPPAGVYAVRVREEDRSYSGVLHVGPRPTFGERAPTIEAHIFNTHNSFYDKELEIFLYSKIRPIIKFRSVEKLKDAIRKDCAAAKRVLARDRR